MAAAAAVLGYHASVPMQVAEEVAEAVDIAVVVGVGVVNVAGIAETVVVVTVAGAFVGCRWADWARKHSHSAAAEAWGEGVAEGRGWTMSAGLYFLNLAANPSAVGVCCVGETCRSAWAGKRRPDGEDGCAGRNCDAGGAAASCRQVVVALNLP